MITHWCGKIGLLAFLFIALLAPASKAAQKPNVLFILVDDLRAELSCYGSNHIHSPNIDAFAATGMVFERAYCQQSVCNPSRTSLLTGMRPDATGVVGNHAHFRSANPEIVTLPQYFKSNGYHAAAIGKIYHGVFPDGASITKWDTMGDPESWSVPAIRFGPRYYYTEAGIAAAKKVYQRIYRPANPSPNAWTQKLVFGPATEAPDVADNQLYDGKVADAAVDALKGFQDSEKPFFLAVGFIKPHSPYIAPKEYFDLYKDVSLPSDTVFPAGAPSFAGHSSGELRRYTDQPKKGPISIDNQMQVRRAYYACISYIDAQIGRVLDQLEQAGLSENTIVMLAGDHGYHLGEHSLWGKTTNFELDTRVPLIVRAPGMKGVGKRSQSLIELVDLYPTLTELAGLPSAKKLQGESFVPVLDNPKVSIKSAALSQYPRRGLMGYSMRTAEHRLTQWMDTKTGSIREAELYEYSDGLVERKNIAAKKPKVVAQLAAQLQEKFGIETGEVAKTSFENSEVGAFEELKTQLGIWTSETGRSVVDHKHAKTGKQCLHLTGGEKTSVILRLEDSAEASGILAFWAERWTSRSPFSFRIDKETKQGWQEIYHGDAKVKVGRAFLNHVKIPLGDPAIKRLRFTVGSPKNTGVLIDDIEIVPARPQKILDVQMVPITLPALQGGKASKLAKLKVETTGLLSPISITKIRGAVVGDDVSSIQISGAKTQPQADGSFVIQIEAGQGKLAGGENVFLVEGELGSGASIDGRVGATIHEVTFSNGKIVKLDSPPVMQRLGVAVRNGGDDGVHTYRIPGLVTTNKGTLIGVYDVRHDRGVDLPGNIDVGMSRSIDGGRTWQPMKVIMDMGSDPDWHYDGVGDPAILVDRNTGTIWVAGTWSHGNRSWRGSGPGLAPEETGQLMLVRSDDDGVTWSKPINITKQIKDPKLCFILQGPGKGITMRDGTIVFAAQYQDPPEQKRLPHSTIIYSKDHGETWQVGTGAFDDTTEAQVIEVEPGVLMLNCRYNRKSVRVVMTTRDMGETWQKHPTSERSLIEPGSCMASLIDTGDWLLFSNPDSTRGRNHITIKASPDKGMTWPKAYRLLLDEGSGRGYSCMTMIDAQTVGILYEGSQADMTFQRIPLSELIEKPKRTEPLAVVKPKLTLPQVFGNHMVLQSGTEIPVWGSAKPGAKVTVKLGKQAAQVAEVDNQGKWSLRLQPEKPNASGLAMLIESAGEQIRFSNILIGEVWICAGQSNMEWTLRQSALGDEELASADHPQIRLLHLQGGATGSSGSYTEAHLARLEPGKYSLGTWQVASADSARNFSAVSWYFGRKLQRDLKVPVGLICPAIGGTPTEAWIPTEALAADQTLKGMVAGNWMDNELLGDFCRTRGQQNLLRAMQAGDAIPGDAQGPNHSFKPGFMWSAGIEPLIPYAIRGAIWYQGESNAETPARVRQHSQLLPVLIDQWRSKWGQGDFPFLYVQLPALNRPAWPEFRDSQRRILDLVKNTGMAVTIDTGHPSNVHPKEKKPVGERLAMLASAAVKKSRLYTVQSDTVQCTVTSSGPLFERVERMGKSLVVTFTEVGEGLKVALPDDDLHHFEIRAENGGFVPLRLRLLLGIRWR